MFLSPVGRWTFSSLRARFTGPRAKELALGYARGRFGGRSGEIRVYDNAGSAVAKTFPIERERR